MNLNIKIKLNSIEELESVLNRVGEIVEKNPYTKRSLRETICIEVQEKKSSPFNFKRF